jgi:CheY-like chemotaxis protein
MRQFSTLSILLLEDEYLIALDAEEILTSFGVKHIQIVNTLAAAAEAAESGDFDVAILDLNINGEMSFAVAEMFQRRGTPIVFATGYELRDRVDPDLGVCLKKPYTSESLRDALELALSKPVVATPPADEAGKQL